MPDNTLVISILSRSLVAGTPLLLATLGEIMAERSGVMNLGVEGMMAVGAVTGFAVTLKTGNPWLGLGAAMLAGLLLSALHALFTVSLRANQIVSGLALTTLGLGLSGLLGKPFVGTPLPNHFEALPIPFLSDLPIVGPAVFKQDPVFYLSLILGATFWFGLYQTRWGLMIRSAGEFPAATEVMSVPRWATFGVEGFVALVPVTLAGVVAGWIGALLASVVTLGMLIRRGQGSGGWSANTGVPVWLIRFWCVLAGGAMAGAAGGYLSLAYSPSWIEGMTAGRGWIVIALTIFAGWNPLKAFVGAYLFGGVFVCQYFLQDKGIPPNFLLMLPYIVTLLALMSGSLRGGRRSGNGPAALGVPY